MGFIHNIYSKLENLIQRAEERVGNETASVFYILVATSTFVTMICWAKVHANEIPPVQSQVLRGILLSTLIYMNSTHHNISLAVPDKRQDKLRLLRNLLASLYNVISFFIVTKIPISTALIIQSSTPFTIAFLDHFIYKTTYTKVETIFSFVSMLGVAFMVKPDLFFDIQIIQEAQYGYADGWERVFWVIFYFISTIFWAISAILLKTLKSMNPMALNFPFGIFLAASSALVQVNYEQLKSPSIWIYVQACFFVGIVSFINQTSYVKANQKGKPAKLAMIFNLNVVLSFLFEIFYLGEERQWHSFAGALLIVGSSIILSISRLK